MPLQPGQVDRQRNLPAAALRQRLTTMAGAPTTWKRVIQAQLRVRLCFQKWQGKQDFKTQRGIVWVKKGRGSIPVAFLGAEMLEVQVRKLYEVSRNKEEVVTERGAAGGEGFI